MPESDEPFRIIESITPEGYTEPAYAGRPKNLTELFKDTVEKYGDREAFSSLLGGLPTLLIVHE